MSAARFYAPALDGLRAVAFAVVFCSHVPGLWFFPGGFGVTVFFFLSGYLITTLLRIEVERTGHIHLGHFYARRFLRILPPYVLTLLCVWGAAAAGAFGEPLQTGPLVWQALFATNYWIVLDGGAAALTPGTEVYWSLAVEEHFYLLFPWLAVVLFRFLPRGRDRAVALLLMCAAVLAWRIALFTAIDPGDVMRLTYASDTRIDSILFGCALALWGNPVLDPSPPAISRYGGAVLAAAGILIAATLVPRDPLFRETLRYSIQGALLVPVYYVLLARSDLGVSRFLARPWMRWLGTLSYTLYLVHDSVIQGLRHLAPMPTAGTAIVALALSIAYAAAMHRLVERPLAAARARMRAVETEPAAAPDPEPSSEHAAAR